MHFCQNKLIRPKKNLNHCDEFRKIKGNRIFDCPKSLMKYFRTISNGFKHIQMREYAPQKYRNKKMISLKQKRNLLYNLIDSHFQMITRLIKYCKF